jgi:ribokinase
MRERGAPLVVVIGSVNIDHVVVTDVFPRPGETVQGRSARVALGGKGSNQAVAAALAGARTAMVARIGDDLEGEAARKGLARHGVDIDQVRRVEGSATGTAWITVAQEDNSIVVVAGANHGWHRGDDPLTGTGAEAAVVLAQLEIPLEVVTSAAQHCAGRFLLNAAPASELPDELLARCDVLIVNEHEQNLVAGLPDGSPVADAHVRLRSRGARSVVTTLGAAGSVVTDPQGQTTRIAAIPAEVVDSTGAGDAFVGVLAARLAAGDDLATAARWGTAAGSLAVRAAGTQDSYADLATMARVFDGREARP